MSFWDGTQWVAAPVVRGSDGSVSGARVGALTPLAVAAMLALLPLQITVASGPLLSLSPDTGPAGTVVSVAGTGFAPRTQIELTWDGSSSGLPSVTSGRDGSFVTKITVPASSAGSHAVGAATATTSTTTTTKKKAIGNQKTWTVATSTPFAVVAPSTTPTPTVTPGATASPSPTPSASGTPPAPPPSATPMPTGTPALTTLTISSVTATNVSVSGATVSWTVSAPATGQVDYGTTTAYGQTTTAETSFNYTTHVQSIAGLQAATQYHYRVRSQDQGGSVAVSSDYTFVTLPAISPTPAPTTTPVSTSGTPYGAAVTMDGLGNTQVGGTNGSPNRIVAQRFRASQTAPLTGVRITFPNMNPGYAGGTGGTMNVSIQTDDGTSAHDPSGIVLAQTSIAPRDLIALTNWPLIQFSTPPLLTAGTLYHVVFRNTDPAPATNFVSIDAMYMTTAVSPRQPRYSNTDWALLYRDTSWQERSQYTPIMALVYGTGIVDGIGYVYSDVGSPKTISGAAMARETFTVSGSDRVVSSVSVRLRLTSGSDPLTVRLETSSGALIEAVLIPAASLTSSSAVWATANFSTAHALAAGQAYNLVLSSAAGYSVFAPYEGSAYGHWEASTYFSDGRAQFNSGSGWTDWGSRTDHDLEFYFR